MSAARESQLSGGGTSWLPYWPVIVAILGAAVVYGATDTRLQAVERRMDRFETQQREDLNKILEGVNDVRDRLARIEGRSYETTTSK